ncbi:hypothetical protein [Variovorax soli]|uniref:hypothetical protein n=1 Tax=Variovorax soli TaxID=376815 RepID=UPI000B03BDF5|nr:hypothetical protein [Variovorax soli]
MNTDPQKHPLRLVVRAHDPIDADMVAYTAMEDIDANCPAVWERAPVDARAKIRNAIVRAVRAQEKR